MNSNPTVKTNAITIELIFLTISIIKILLIANYDKFMPFYLTVLLDVLDRFLHMYWNILPAAVEGDG